ncbi:hypothetical protein ACFXNW_09080 [Nocardia sp. NPDC059180]|uniref:hypothetical protein n=1 Tax=Nocardia sp. NPDC059180 TaxID=3346761 RepID=UPI0036924457
MTDILPSGTDIFREPDTDTLDYLDHVFGTDTGHAYLLIQQRGKSRGGERPRRRRWPAERENLARLIRGHDGNVWACPYLMRTDYDPSGHKKTGRVQRNAVARRRIHCDADTPGPDHAEIARALHGWAVESSPGKAHIYIEVTRELTYDEHHALCKALCARIPGGDPSKVTDENLLRPVGASNHKTDPPSPVGFLVHPNEATPWDPDALAAELGIDLTADADAVHAPTTPTAVAADVAAFITRWAAPNDRDLEHIAATLELLNPDNRHGTAQKTLNMACEEMGAGMVSSAVLDAVRKWFDLAKPEQAPDEFSDMLAHSVGKALAKTPAELDAIAERARLKVRCWAEDERIFAILAPECTQRVEEEHDGEIYVKWVVESSAPEPVTPIALDEVHAVFRKWLGNDYDLDALDVVLAAAAVERLDGDPLWVLLVSGPGNAKTETVQALAGAGAIIASTVASEGALLSGTAQKQRAKNATGGLLRSFCPGGVLVVKDVTTLLSMSGDARGPVLAALREIYDGKWVRNVGVDGGRTLEWVGRIAIVGAVTTAWDSAHSVIAAMGDRFVLLRMDSRTPTVRRAAGRRALSNTGHEVEMRAELAAAVAGVLAGVGDGTPPVVEDAEQERLLDAADLVTLARTGVERDYQGNVIDAHAPEMATRFAKQLLQVVRGGLAIGLSSVEGVRLAIRCAADSVPPLRLAILRDLAAHPHSSTQEVRKRLGKARNSVDRELQALHMLELLECDEMEIGPDRTRWFYTLAAEVDLSVFD